MSNESYSDYKRTISIGNRGRGLQRVIQQQLQVENRKPSISISNYKTSVFRIVNQKKLQTVVTQQQQQQQHRNVVRGKDATSAMDGKDIINKVINHHIKLHNNNK